MSEVVEHATEALTPLLVEMVLHLPPLVEQVSRPVAFACTSGQGLAKPVKFQEISMQYISNGGTAT